MAAAGPQGVATQTALTVSAQDHGGRTQAAISVSVSADDGLPATGAVVISDQGQPLAGVALNAQGQASTVLALASGSHNLSAAYTGDATHLGSASAPAAISALATSTADFQISVAPVTLTLTAGQSSTLIATVTPENSNTLSSPMFVTLSCSGLPNQASCTFTPENVEILPNVSTALTSSMVIATQVAGSGKATPPLRLGSSPVAWAFLLPGALGLGGLAWGARRRPWLHRISLLLLLALVTMLGTTACNPRYYYLNHGPQVNPPTPSGVYSVSVTAQSSNGVTAITHSTPLAFTVK
jgi:hypothetical protein